MDKIMIFRHDNSGPSFRLSPMDVPDTVTMDSVEEWLKCYGHVNDVFTVVEVSRKNTYTVKQKPPEPQTPVYYVERVPAFSIHNHEENGR